MCSTIALALITLTWMCKPLVLSLFTFILQTDRCFPAAEVDAQLLACQLVKLVPPAMSLPLGSSPHTPSPLQRAAVAKHNVLPFQRSCGTRQRASWDVGTSQSQIEPAGSSTVPNRRSFAFGDHNSPRTSSPRVQHREKVAPRRVLQGFDVTHTGTSLESRHGVSSATGTAGLLTRQLSGGLTQTRAIEEAPAFVQQVPPDQSAVAKCCKLCLIRVLVSHKLAQSSI